jgi:hypothetical protein
MATTVGNFTAIDDTEVDAESPITESLITRLRDNAYWVNEGTTKTSQGTGDKLLQTDGAGGVEWIDKSTVGIDGTKGSGVVGISSGAPAQIAEVTGKTLILDIKGDLDAAIFLVDLVINQSDLTYSGSIYTDTTGTKYNSTSGTLTSSFVAILPAGSTSFYVRATGGNIEFYESDNAGANYHYYWL